MGVAAARIASTLGAICLGFAIPLGWWAWVRPWSDQQRTIGGGLSMIAVVIGLGLVLASRRSRVRPGGTLPLAAVGFIVGLALGLSALISQGRHAFPNRYPQEQPSTE